ncbi:ras-like protein family member 12 isoform 2-T2 [Sarcophilus harrisii]
MSSVFGKPRSGNLGPERLAHSSIPEVNVAILGCRGAGKSALTVKFLTKRFISEYDPNLEDTYTSEETVDQQPILLRVMDTADQDVPKNCKRYLNWAQAFLVVYSIDDRRNFEGCSQYLEIIAHHTKDTQHDCPVLLLGNKLDMAQYRITSYVMVFFKNEGQITSQELTVIRPVKPQKFLQLFFRPAWPRQGPNVPIATIHVAMFLMWIPLQPLWPSCCPVNHSGLRLKPGRFA